MHPTHAPARRWPVFAVLVLTLLGHLTAGAAPASAADRAPAARTPAVEDSNFAGGYIAPSVRVPARPVGDDGVHADAAVPDSVDLRASAPEVGDQGPIGACVTWTLSHSIMGYYVNRGGGAGAPYAPLFLYMRNVADGGAPEAGLNPDAVLTDLKANGVDTQDDYWQGTANWHAPPTAAQIANARNYRVSGWTRLFAGARQGADARTVIQQSLAAGTPVALGLPIYRDFQQLRAHTVYNTLSGTSLGGHMVTAFGYDADGVIIRNQWGTGWGNGGDAKLSWAYVTGVVDGAWTVAGIVTPVAPVPVAPTVAALSVTSATAGSAVTVTGAGLAAATAVRFGGVAATFSPVTANGVTRLMAVAPPHADGAVTVTVTNPTGTSPAGPASTFTYLPPAPSITAMSPNAVSVLGGTTVTVSGTGLAGVTGVRLGATLVPTTGATATSLTFVAPARKAGTVDVTAADANGTSATGPATKLTYVSPPAPVVQSLSPSSGLSHTTTTVLVAGTNFTGASKVTVGGSTVGFTPVSDTRMKLYLGARAPGPAAVQVTTPGGVNAAGTNSTFTYVEQSVPAVTSVAPNTGATTAKTAVVLTGTNLTGATRVTSGGVALGFVRISDTQLRMTLPVHAAGQVDIQVTTPAGVSPLGSDARFTYVTTAGPTIGSVSPAAGSAAVTNTVFLSGTNFTGATKVTANGTSAPFYRISATQVRVVLVPRAAGTVSLVVTTPAGSSPAGTFTAVGTGAPVVSSVSPASGRTNQLTPLVLTGTGLSNVTKLTFGGRRTAFTPVSSTSMKMTAPLHAAGAVPIVVTTKGGSSAPVTFTYVAPAVPTLSAISPSTGPTNAVTKVGLVGTGLTGATKVTSSTGRAVVFTRISDTQITVTMPPRAAGAVTLKVTTPGGTTATVTFTYTTQPVPTVTALSPSAGPANRVAVVTVTGTALKGATKVLVGGTAMAFQPVSATQLKVSLKGRPAGTYALVITTPGGTSTVTASTRYTFS